MNLHHTCRLVEGVEIHTLSNDLVAFSVAPEFGARVVSIRDLAANREWLDGWSPDAARRLWRPADPAVYATGPGAGIDECVPTVLPCTVAGSDLPDHGELWNDAVPVAIDPARGTLGCEWSLKSLPLVFRRVISLAPGRLVFAYEIENLADDPTPFQWA